MLREADGRDWYACARAPWCSYHQYVVLPNANTELADGVGASGGLGISWSFERVDLAVPHRRPSRAAPSG